MYLLSVRGCYKNAEFGQETIGRFTKRKIKNYEQIVNDINQLESVMETLSDDELRQKTVTFQHMLQKWKNS